DHAKKLDRITFHEKLGTVADKVERVAKLAEWLASEGIVPNCDPALARQAAELAKADLVTEMVGEFPELQGLMGGYYARAEGLPDAVADAIRDHYKPVGQGDDVPTAPVTVAVALADKLDTLACFFAIAETPTGSKDPFALRRQCLGAIRLIATSGLRFDLAKLTNGAISGLIIQRMQSGPAAKIATYNDNSEPIQAMGVVSGPTGNVRQLYQVGSRIIEVPVDDATAENVVDRFKLVGGLNEKIQQVMAFFADRLKVQQREAGVRHDLIDAVFALGGEDDLVRLLARVKALQAFMATEDGTNLLAGYKRAANILKQAGEVSGTVAATPPTDADATLLKALDAAEHAASTAVADERFNDAMAALASLRAPIDAFFDGVMVNDPDEAVRGYRLGLLARFTSAVHGVADFSKIEG
ncbi:MAG: glycine--tRNA ligase subunit beta, partial [Sphingomonadales bacterium]